MSARIHLLCWNAAEAAGHAGRLREAGYEVTDTPPGGPVWLQALAAAPPDAMVIDLERRPSVGRDVAVTLRCRKGTRHIPLVFAGGDPEKVAGVRALLPDATYTGWDAVAGALAEAIAHPPAEPVVPSSLFAGYEGAPLAKKLGIKPGAVVALLGAPEGFADTLGGLPEGVTFRDTPGPCTLTLWFLRSPAELTAGIGTAVAQAAHGPVWAIWPKQGSGAKTGLSQQGVREAGLAAGLVDYKICAVDATWSGLLFRWRG